jgi:hypothetical protein
MITRELEKLIRTKMNKGKAIVLLGPRQTGKTTLMLKIASETEEFLLLNCDDAIVREQLDNANTETIRRLLGKNKLIFIDDTCPAGLWQKTEISKHEETSRRLEGNRESFRRR